MRPLLLMLFAIATVGSCAEQRNLTPNQARLATQVHSYIYDQDQDYRLVRNTKALAGCVEWPKGGSRIVYVDTYGWTYVSDNSDGQVAPRMLIDGAIDQCNAAQSQGGFKCSCQLFDVGGNNTVVVPETVNEKAYVIRSRRGRQSLPKSKSGLQSTRTEDERQKDLNNCGPFAVVC